MRFPDQRFHCTEGFPDQRFHNTKRSPATNLTVMRFPQIRVFTIFH